ncbi:murein hydrolase activator EnvC family protein [Actinomadura opuntiae]|uniref:murein hydrolase activator EnvC family protein n=1 Tax=Actinomadura sp. OS1-43 TaxID=604315 RepID=UPI00255AE188|nr:M23 family metallopeptidase [Actinomadura sp. OS1-43]MDL4818855.1 M23 family metallopeptidase [Actinomadura sp. OS1-43]
MTLLTLLLTCVITTGSPGVSAWRWPLGPPAPQVLRAFSPPAVPWGPGHRGVDLAARPGEPVYAAGAGRVSYAGRLAGRGVVAVDHGPLRTTYLPVRPSVHAGRRVAVGARIGVLEDGRSHCPTSCLHWGLRKGRVYLDPLSLVRREVRLLPRWPRAAPSEEHERHAPPEDPPAPSMTLRDATTATGGAFTGLFLAYSLSFAWRRTRTRARARRPPPGVIDLAHERRLRRTPQRRQERT